MAIITISRGCFSHGKEIAERVAKRLGYRCIGRETVLTEASKFFNVEELTLAKSLHNAPSILERMRGGKKKYLDYIKASLLDLAKEDNLVYHGHAGHFLLPNLKNILKVRIIADLEERIRFFMESRQRSRELAKGFIKQEDSERERWTRYLYGVDISDPTLYDLVVHIAKLRIEDAVELIANTALFENVRSTEKELSILKDEALAMKTKLMIEGICGVEEVRANNGIVYIKCKSQRVKKTTFSSSEYQKRVIESIKDDTIRSIEEIVYKFPEVKEVICEIEDPYYV